MVYCTYIPSCFQCHVKKGRRENDKDHRKSRKIHQNTKVPYEIPLIKFLSLPLRNHITLELNIIYSKEFTELQYGIRVCE